MGEIEKYLSLLFESNEDEILWMINQRKYQKKMFDIKTFDLTFLYFPFSFERIV